MGGSQSLDSSLLSRQNKAKTETELRERRPSDPNPRPAVLQNARAVRPLPGPLQATLRLSLACVATGIITGFFVSLFNTSVVKLQGWLGIAQLIGEKRGAPELIGLPLLGGLAVGLVQRVTKMCGLPVGVRDLKALRDGLSSDRGTASRDVASLFLHSLAAVLSLGCANSVGPMAVRILLGIHISNVTGNILALSLEDHESLLAVGAVAGVAAGAQTPLAATIFGLEQAGPSPEKHGLRIALSMVGAVVAVATSVRGLTVVHVLELLKGSDNSHRVSELPALALLGCICGGLSWLFSKILRPAIASLWKAAEHRGVAREWHPGLAGLCTALVAWLGLPEVLFIGWANFQQVLLHSESFTADRLLVLCLSKLLLTALSHTSGFPGGLFAPSMFAGAAFGGFFGKLVQPMYMISSQKEAPSHLRVYSVVGMAASLGTTCNVPGTAAALLFEITHSVDLVIPCFCGVGAAHLSSVMLDLSFNRDGLAKIAATVKK